ncbi:hypothetical protein like AT2G16900 [Hibiscus trionum]|uniref:Phospholipase-like protein family n=1 Tax=Hibiscus trionum TaxID=183268 RepID=A0A9W7LRK1_HIBTR|nr:hypothetical protein like AT2G16900 [Hibiscus trionum]
MDGNGKVHQNCASAANPYHECGAYCLEKIANGKGFKEKDKKMLDNRYGNKVVRSKRTNDGSRAQPNCPKASNPYHECNENCNQKTSNAATLGVGKESDNRNGIKQGELIRKKNDEGRVRQNCGKASNPYHECDENCFKRSTEAKTESGSKFLDAPRSFDRKKKGSESQPKSPRALEIAPALGAIYHGDPKSLQSHLYREKMEAENAESFPSSQQHSEEIYSRDQSSDKAQIQYSQPLPMSGKIMSPGDTPTKYKEKKVLNSPKVSSDANTEDAKEDATSSTFSFSGIIRALEDSDQEEDVKSVISDSCLSVGKYHVKSSISSTLQSIFDKHGDIAANCHLESASMRAYYLECLCAVIQELHSTSFKQLTKAKVKEIFAVLKDVESANIDVSWLRAPLNEILEAVDLVSQLQTFEAKKDKYKSLLESVKKELESQMENLAQKEKEAADAEELVAKTKARLDDIEHEYSQLDQSLSSIASITEKFRGKSLANELL